MIKMNLEDETCLATDTIVTDNFSAIHIFVKKDGVRIQKLATIHKEKNADYEILVSVRKRNKN